MRCVRKILDYITTDKDFAIDVWSSESRRVIRTKARDAKGWPDSHVLLTGAIDRLRQCFVVSLSKATAAVDDQWHAAG